MNTINNYHLFSQNEYEESFVAVLDIIGFSDALSKKDFNEMYTFMKDLKKCVLMD